MIPATINNLRLPGSRRLALDADCIISLLHVFSRERPTFQVGAYVRLRNARQLQPPCVASCCLLRPNRLVPGREALCAFPAMGHRLQAMLARTDVLLKWTT